MKSSRRTGRYDLAMACRRTRGAVCPFCWNMRTGRNKSTSHCALCNRHDRAQIGEREKGGDLMVTVAAILGFVSALLRLLTDAATPLRAWWTHEIHSISARPH